MAAMNIENYLYSLMAGTRQTVHKACCIERAIPDTDDHQGLACDEWRSSYK